MQRSLGSEASTTAPDRLHLDPGKLLLPANLTSPKPLLGVAPPMAAGRVGAGGAAADTRAPCPGAALRSADYTYAGHLSTGTCRFMLPGLAGRLHKPHPETGPPLGVRLHKPTDQRWLFARGCGPLSGLWFTYPDRGHCGVRRALPVLGSSDRWAPEPPQIPASPACLQPGSPPSAGPQRFGQPLPQAYRMASRRLWGSLCHLQALKTPRLQRSGPVLTPASSEQRCPTPIPSRADTPVLQVTGLQVTGKVAALESVT
uniref:Uncharacterized protein n=1 Tax=Rangifer tarandus platyrhynchus TaxID=3082113 RepID=A0ACB0DWJ2_RANTA|nr:unnamed protein product [Rangifer tarandus platyrhynchus]